MPFFEKSIARQNEFAILVHQGDACGTDFLHGHAPNFLADAYDGTFTAELKDCNRIGTGQDHVQRDGWRRSLPNGFCGNANGFFLHGPYGRRPSLCSQTPRHTRFPDQRRWDSILKGLHYTKQYVPASLWNSKYMQTYCIRQATHYRLRHTSAHWKV